MNQERVSYAGKRIYIGIDVHRAFFVASCVCDGDVVKRCTLSATSLAVISFISKHFPGAEVKTCYEASYCGFWLHRELEAAGISNIVVHPAAIEVAANDRVKTDKRDSLKMAVQLAAGRLGGIRVPSLEEEYRRLLVRTREQLGRARRRTQVQIRMRFHQFGLFPEQLRGALRLTDAQELIDSVEGELKFSLERLLASWKFLEQQMQSINKRIVEQAKNDPLEKIYRSVPGIGPLASRIFSNELGDMSQFRNVRSLYSFTGLTPGEHSTGKAVRKGHISRQGSARLRHVLVEAAWRAIRKDKSLAEQFERIAVKGGKRRAIVAVARRLAGKIRAAVRENVPYEAARKKVA